jgi:hypothetical protein
VSAYRNIFLKSTRSSDTDDPEFLLPAFGFTCFQVDVDEGIEFGKKYLNVVCAHAGAHDRYPFSIVCAYVRDELPFVHFKFNVIE